MLLEQSAQDSNMVPVHSSNIRGDCGIQPTLSSLAKDCPNPNKNPYPNVRKQDLNSSLAGVGCIPQLRQIFFNLWTIWSWAM